jgi:hypothetical protein
MKTKKLIIFLIITLYFSIIKNDLIWETRINAPCTGLNQTASCGDELVCLDNTQNTTAINKLGKCSLCINSDQCLSKAATLACKPFVNKENKVVKTCQHKDLLPGINYLDILAWIVFLFYKPLERISWCFCFKCWWYFVLF